MKTRRAVTYGLYGLAAALVALAAAAMPHLRPRPPVPAGWTQQQPPPRPIVEAAPNDVPEVAKPVAPEERPRVDVVFALDTTSSMTGLIDGAKRKIWSLVNFISSARPQPTVRVGLVGYRDRGDDYVTRFFDLSDDMDTVFQHLRSLRAEGGGDTPEHVAKALHDAVHRPSWSTGDKVVKIVYLVGDAPGHTDYGDGYDFQQIARAAAARGIHLNTIRCGDDTEAGRYFRRVAALGMGQYSTVDESGGVEDERSPFDDKLALLNRRLLGTAVAYGRGAGAIAEKVATAAAAPAAVAADRVAFVLKHEVAVSGDGDLIAEAKSKGAAWVNTLAPSELPSSLAAMEPARREAFVARKQAERREVMEEIARVSADRDAFLKRAAAARPRPSGFDARVKDALKAQSAGLLAF